MERADIRILVLDHGEVVEFGTPWELIQKDGMFRELCRQSGEDTQLMEVSLVYLGFWSELTIDGQTC
jgi:hypothetical protein